MRCIMRVNQQINIKQAKINLVMRTFMFLVLLPYIVTRNGCVTLDCLSKKHQLSE